MRLSLRISVTFLFVFSVFVNSGIAKSVSDETEIDDGVVSWDFDPSGEDFRIGVNDQFGQIGLKRRSVIATSLMMGSDEKGNGGRALKCSAGTDNLGNSRYEYYSLDHYFRNEMIPLHLKNTSPEMTFVNIARHLKKELPVLGKIFETFYQSFLLAIKDPSAQKQTARFFWRGVDKLVDKDMDDKADLLFPPPYGCQNVPFVWTQKMGKGRTYVYKKEIMKSLIAKNLEDWIVIHEFNWILPFSSEIKEQEVEEDLNRRLNDYFHSASFFKQTGEEIRNDLSEFGIDIESERGAELTMTMSELLENIESRFEDEIEGLEEIEKKARRLANKTFRTFFLKKRKPNNKEKAEMRGYKNLINEKVGYILNPLIAGGLLEKLFKGEIGKDNSSFFQDFEKTVRHYQQIANKLDERCSE